MAKVVIPNDLYVGFQIRSTGRNTPSEDGGKNVALGFVTYRNKKDVLQHQEAFDRWRDEEIPRIPFDNLPTKHMNIIGFVSRYSTSNKYIRIEDPRNFQVEITVENLINILKEITVIDGIIQDDMAWGWENGLHLYKVGSDSYLQGKANFDYDGSPNIKPKEVNLGDEVLLGNGKTGIYYGAYHVAEAGCWSFSMGRVISGVEKYDSKRRHFIKINNKFEFFASIQIKKVTAGDTMTNEEALDILNKYIETNVKRCVFNDAYNSYCSNNDIERSVYHGDDRTVRARALFTLDDTYSPGLLESDDNQEDFSYLFMIQDKKFDNFKFKNYIVERKEYYGQMLPV